VDEGDFFGMGGKVVEVEVVGAEFKIGVVDYSLVVIKTKNFD